ncbi:hypothetical protein OH492_12550 [Vibrio chagasii]|nr:hypothetical protein [Vibrio chagasii]
MSTFTVVWIHRSTCSNNNISAVYKADATKSTDQFGESGVPGGRCGCRSPQEVLELAQTMNTPALSLQLSALGIEVYEGCDSW